MAAESLFLVELLQRLGFEIQLTVKTDSSAAKGIGLRLGAGKLRSLEIRTLWLQQLIKDKRLGIAKTAGSKNPADVGTKAYKVETLSNLKCLGMMTPLSAML